MAALAAWRRCVPGPVHQFTLKYHRRQDSPACRQVYAAHSAQPASSKAHANWLTLHACRSGSGLGDCPLTAEQCSAVAVLLACAECERTVCIVGLSQQNCTPGWLVDIKRWWRAAQVDDRCCSQCQHAASSARCWHLSVTHLPPSALLTPTTWPLTATPIPGQSVIVYLSVFRVSH